MKTFNDLGDNQEDDIEDEEGIKEKNTSTLLFSTFIYFSVGRIADYNAIASAISCFVFTSFSPLEITDKASRYPSAYPSL